MGAANVSVGSEAALITTRLARSTDMAEPVQLVRESHFRKTTNLDFVF